MISVETALRLAIIGQEILLAAVFLASRGNLVARVSGALLLLSVAAYLVISDPILRERSTAFLPVLTLLAIAVPYCLWSFARAVFEAAWPRKWLVSGFVLLGLSVWVLFLARDRFAHGLWPIADVALHVASLVAVGHALFMAAGGRPDDLVERRRRFRVAFVVIVAMQVAAVLVVELFLPEPGLAWLDLLNVSVIAVLTIALAVPLLRLDPEFFALVPIRDIEGSPAQIETLSAAQSVLKATLSKVMSEGAFRQSGLTIRALADQLGSPEHQLRKLINGHLGYRNFSAFLNSYRIPEAKRILSDPGQVRTPVLTIALDLGYGSLGPFNRAFKTATDMTPTEYRRTSLQTQSAETE
jgi:AraC-like DNA-binding protein